MTLMSLMLIVVLTALGADVPEGSPHAAEVKLFASTMATVKVVTAACPMMVANAPYLAGLRDRLHITDADRPAFTKDASPVAAALGQGLTEASSRDVWCLAARRLYGPEGSMIPDLFVR